MKQSPQDFQVDEIPLLSPSGEGEHVWLHVRKVGANTDWVAGQLARLLAVPKKQVSYAGMKDRHAVTTQWFSVQLPGQATPSILLDALTSGVNLLDWVPSHKEGEAGADKGDSIVEVLAVERHSRKLKRGALKGNTFTIRLTDCLGDLSILPALINKMNLQGVPNYYGSQRFGHGYRNVQQAEQWFTTGRRPRKREQSSIYLSAARSWLFNQILAARVEQGMWNKAMAGDVFILDGSHSCFSADGDEAIDQRLEQADIHPSCALWGQGELLSSLELRTLEESVADQYSVLAKGLMAQRLDQERRSTRIMPHLSLESLEKDTVIVKMRLEAGVFATSVLSELGVFTEA